MHIVKHILRLYSIRMFVLIHYRFIPSKNEVDNKVITILFKDLLNVDYFLFKETSNIILILYDKNIITFF